MGRTIRVAAAGVVLVGMLAGVAGAAGYGHVRDGWMYGLNLGYGWTKLSATDVSTAQSASRDSGWEGDLAGGLKVGFCPSDNLAYGIDFSGWTDYTILANYDRLKTTAYWIMAQVHWFPTGQGLYVRGGLGLGTVGLSLNDPLVRISQSNSGLGWGLGVGWEVRVSPSFALGVGYDYRGVNTGSVNNDFDGSTILEDFAAATQFAALTLTWYPD